MSKKKKQLTEEEQLEQLQNVGIVRQGTKLIVPEKVDLSVAIQALSLKQQEEEQIIAVNYQLDNDVAEGMVAFLRVLQNEFGFVSNTGRNSFFGRQPPQFLGIETSPGKKETIPVGNLRIPGIDGWLTPTFGFQHNRVCFKIEGEIKGKDRHKVDEIVNKVKQECRNNSIYKGHAIMTSFPEVDECSSLEDTFPTFAKLNEVQPKDVIFSADTAEQVEVSLFMPIMKTDRCREHKIPLKRGILLEGPYGVGKTLTAAATATLCKQNGWTFIYLKDVTRLSQAYAFAEQYQPAVIFAEDIDQVLKNSQRRDEEVNDILNALDGIDTKGIEVITVLTTNHLEKITQAMLRPGRLDTVVPVRAPDAEAAEKLVRLYAGKLLAKNADLEKVGKLLHGEIPALIREVVERSKLAALRREGALRLEAEDIEVTAKGMKNHMNLLKPQEADNRSEREKAAQIMADGQVRAATVQVSKFKEELDQKSGMVVSSGKPNGSGKKRVSAQS